MSGWVDIAAMTMEKTGCGQMKLHGYSKIGFRGSLTTLGEYKLISPSILMNQAIGTTTLHLKKSHFYVLGTKVCEFI